MGILMTDDRKLALKDMAEHQLADTTAALIAVKEIQDILQGIRQRAKDLAQILRDDDNPR